jgi:hypothetical protein
MVLNGQGPSCYPLGGVPYLDLDTVLSEQGSGRRILSDTLHHHPGVVKMSKCLRIWLDGCRYLKYRVAYGQRFQVVWLAGRAGRATSWLIAIRTMTRTINRLFKKIFRLFKKLFRFRRQIFRPRCRYFGFLFRYFGFLFTYFGFRFIYFGFRFTYFGFRFTYFGFRAPNRVACNDKQYMTDLDD